MDEEQYDLLLFLMSKSELVARRNNLLAAQRVERHQPDGDPGQYAHELNRIDLELVRRWEEDEPPF